MGAGAAPRRVEKRGNGVRCKRNGCRVALETQIEEHVYGLMLDPSGRLHTNYTCYRTGRSAYGFEVHHM